MAGTKKEEVYPVKTREAVRYLGVFFSEKDQQQTTHKAVKDEINKVLETLKRKRITDVQTSYILSKVMIPRIEYRLANGWLAEHQCIKLLAKYLPFMKRNLDMATSAPNVAITFPDLYMIKSVRQIHHALLTNALNRDNDLRTTTLIRLKTLQIKNWIPHNILSTKESGHLITNNN